MSAAEYRRMFEIEDSYWWFVGKRKIVKSLLVKYADLQPEHLVLDAGCGTGATLAELAGVCRPVGADYEQLAIDLCRKRGVTRACRADVTQLPFADSLFSAVICTDLLEHLPDDRPALSEFYRVLRPGGILLVSVPAFMLLWTPHDEALGHYRRYQRLQICRLVREAGFEIRKSSYTVFWLFFVKLLMRLLKRVFFRKQVESNTFLDIHPILNHLLIRWMKWEAGYLRKGAFPVGTSVICLARKP